MHSMEVLAVRTYSMSLLSSLLLHNTQRLKYFETLNSFTMKKLKTLICLLAIATISIGSLNDLNACISAPSGTGGDDGHCYTIVTTLPGGYTKRTLSCGDTQAGHGADCVKPTHDQ